MSQEKKSGSDLPRRGYVFLVTALTIFLLGIIVLRTPVRGYLVTAELSCQAAEDSSGNIAESIRDEVIAEVNLKRALQHVGPPPAAESESSTPFPSKHQIKQFGNLLQVQALPRKNSDGTTEVHLSLVGKDENWTTALVNRLAQQLVATRLQSNLYQQSHAIDPDLEEWFQDTQEKEKKAQQELDRFMASHFQELTKNSATDDALSAGKGPADKGAEPSALSQPTQTENPQWKTIDQKIKGMIYERETLLIKYTKAHPRVRDLDWSIKQFQDRRDKLSHYVEATEQEKTEPAEVSPTNRLVKPEKDYSGTLSKYEELKEKVAAANQARIAARETYANQFSLASTATTGSIELLQAARVTDRLGGAPPGSLVLLLGLLSVILAAVMARWAASGVKPVTFESAARVEQELSLPVIGEISTTDGPALPALKPNRSRFAKICTLGCELTLGLLVLGFFFMALLDSSLVSQFIDDPFGAINETVSRVATRQF